MARILQIDDEAPIRENQVGFLVLEEHQVLQAADRRPGLEPALKQGAAGYVTQPFNLANRHQLLATRLTNLPQTPPRAV